jgi:hypothetical protein
MKQSIARVPIREATKGNPHIPQPTSMPSGTTCLWPQRERTLKWDEPKCPHRGNAQVDTGCSYVSQEEAELSQGEAEWLQEPYAMCQEGYRDNGSRIGLPGNTTPSSQVPLHRPRGGPNTQ